VRFRLPQTLVAAVQQALPPTVAVFVARSAVVVRPPPVNFVPVLRALAFRVVAAVAFEFAAAGFRLFPVV
jgi:hypothetical protein